MKNYDCLICGKDNIHFSQFSIHLDTHNILPRDYYCQYLFPNQESHPKCSICNKDLKFIKMSKGFQKFCSVSCSMKKSHIVNQKDYSERSKQYHSTNPKHANLMATKMHKKHPNLARNRGKQTMRDLHKIKTLTNFFSYAENEFNEYFKFLYPTMTHGNCIFSVGNGHYRCDFKINDLIIEIDGSIHNSKKQQLNDKFKDKKYKELGYKILRIENQEVFTTIKSVENKIHNLLQGG